MILPARYGSTRFPGKPMIQHGWERTRLAKHVDALAIATDDLRIRDTCLAIGAQVEMTSPDHPTGTDRLAEVAARHDHDVIVNVQGDEPLIVGFVIDAAAEALLSSERVGRSSVLFSTAGKDHYVS